MKNITSKSFIIYLIILLLIILNLFQLLRVKKLENSNKKFYNSNEYFRNQIETDIIHQNLNFTFDNRVLSNHVLSEILSNTNKPVLFFRFFDNRCSSCGDSLLSQLKYVQEHNRINQLVILVDSNQEHYLKVLLLNNKFTGIENIKIKEIRGYLLDTDFEENAVSYYFISDVNLKCYDFFIPYKYNRNLTIEYLRVMKGKYNL